MAAHSPARPRRARRSRARYVNAVAALPSLALGLWAYFTFVIVPGADSLDLSGLLDRPIELLVPEWLGVCLLIPFVWAATSWSLSDLPPVQQALNILLRGLFIAALAVAMAQPVTIGERHAEVTTVYLVDVSESVPDALLEQAQRDVQAAWAGRGDGQVRLVTFAREAREVAIPPGAASVPPIERHAGAGAGLASDLGAGLRLATGLYDEDAIKRAVVISDGNLNRGDVLSDVIAANRYGIVVHAQTHEVERPDEVLIRNAIFPDDILADSNFELTLELFSTYTGEVSLDITQNEFRDVRGQTVRVRAGEIVEHRVVLQVYEPGLRTFRIDLEAARDRFDDNNHITHQIDVEGRPRVLYVEGDSRRRTYLQRALDSSRNSRVDFELDVRTARGFPTGLSEMEGFELIILSDVDASQLSRESMTNLRTYVRQGGSFLMVGGEDSFGPGGYQGTTMEEILPVTFEGRRLETQPSVAIMLVIDRSGSMEGIKLEMAKDAARAAVELLGPQDRVGVLAFDTAVQRVVRLQSASNRLSINSDISRITPGGGTDILPALEEAYIELLDTRARIKHVILLTDGEAPREGISDLVRMMRSDRITISTVGVGGDADRHLLEMIADISGGRFHYTSSPRAIPQIFVQETSQVARTSLVEEPFRPREVRTSAATRGIDFDTAPYLLGYVQTRPKRTATVGLETERGDPLYAWWRFGRGRAAVFTSDCKNRWMAEWIREPLYARFWAQVVAHLTPERAEEEDRLAMDVRIEHGQGRIRVDAIDDDEQFVNGLSSSVTVTGPDGMEQQISLRQTASGRYQANFDVDAFGSYVVEAEHQLGEATFATSLESIANPYPDEYLAVAPDYSVLRQAVELAGGDLNPDVASLFDPGDAEVVSERELWPYLLFLALGLLVVDILLRRIRLYGRTSLPWDAVTRA